jgi:AraC-like DNA-binding protein
VTLLLDSGQIAPPHRTDALRAAVGSAIVPSLVLLDEVAGGASARVEALELGAGVLLLEVATSGCQLSRTARHVRQAAPERLSLSLPRRGRSVAHQADLTWGGTDGELRLLDLARPFAFRQLGPATSQALYADHDQLGLPLDLIRRAAPRLPSSPVYELTRNHLLHLRESAALVEGQPAAALLGSATLDLVRALVVTAAQDDGRTREALAHSLFVRATTHVRQHLGDPDLSPGRVAAEHDVSLRYLHRVFADQGTSVWEWIVRERLEGARRQLAGDPRPHVTVAAVARRWGFRDARHFARRFRAAYGLSPGECRSTG